MKKVTLIIALLGVVTLGGLVFKQNISDTRSGRISTISGSFAGEKLHKATLSIDGMWCASCAVGAQYSLKALEGVADAYIGFTENLDGEGWVVYEPSKVTDEQIVKAVEPYQATIVSDTVYTETK